MKRANAIVGVGVGVGVRAPVRNSAIAAALALTAIACRSAGSGREETSEPPASPQANAVPAPLTTLPSPPPAAASPAGIDAGPPPETMRPFAPVPPDNAARDGAGYALTIALRFPEAPTVARGDIPAATIEAARKKADPTLSVELMPARARVVLHGRGFLLPEGSELRMRSDLYGATLVDPSGASYRTLAPGTTRAVFDERRIDEGPLTPAELSPGAGGALGAHRLGYPTRRVEAWTRAAKATFELARVQDAGDGGVLLCRLLLDWMSAPPSTPLCESGEVPFHAEIRWAPRGAMVLDAVSIVRRLDLAAANLQAPPAASRFDASSLPPLRSGSFFTAAELAALRPGGESATLVLANDGDETRIAWVDGVPVAWLAPSVRLDVAGLPKAKVTVEWRTFFDDAEKPPPAVIALPGVSEASGNDAGAPSTSLPPPSSLPVPAPVPAPHAP